MSISSTSSNISKSDSTIELYQGETKDLDLEIVQCVEQPDGSELEQPVDLTGAKICFTVRKKLGDPTANISKDSDNALEIELLSPFEDGKAIIHIVSADTEHMEPSSYVFDVWVVLSSGKKVPVIEPSEFLIKEPVTKDC